MCAPDCHLGDLCATPGPPDCHLGDLCASPGPSFPSPGYHRLPQATVARGLQVFRAPARQQRGALFRPRGWVFKLDRNFIFCTLEAIAWFKYWIPCKTYDACNCLYFHQNLINKQVLNIGSAVPKNELNFKVHKSFETWTKLGRKKEKRIRTFSILPPYPPPQNCLGPPGI
jgi:hypothetical protein